jgi:C4-dicarboxylate-specific signal transduction histidine kinase
LRQPLAAILSNAQAARRLLALSERDAEVSEILEDIVACDKRAAGILQQLEDALRSDGLRKAQGDEP